MTERDAAGPERSPFGAIGAPLDGLDLYDGLRAEVDRLGALAELAICATDEFDPGRLRDVGTLLRDVEERMREILRRADPMLRPRPGRRITASGRVAPPSGAGRGAVRTRGRGSSGRSAARG